MKSKSILVVAVCITIILGSELSIAAPTIGTFDFYRSYSGPRGRQSGDPRLQTFWLGWANRSRATPIWEEYTSMTTTWPIAQMETGGSFSISPDNVAACDWDALGWSLTNGQEGFIALGIKEEHGQYTHFYKEILMTKFGIDGIDFAGYTIESIDVIVNEIEIIIYEEVLWTQDYTVDITYNINGYLGGPGHPAPAVIPAPPAILLGSIGVGFVSWLRRRRKL